MRASATEATMGRTDHFHDWDAPRPNSLVPAVSAIVADEHHGLLLHRRSDNELWSIPGGRIEVGESVREAAVREVREETGIEAEPVRLVGVYSDPRAVVAYDDGEIRQQFSVCVACRPSGGALSTESDESLEVQFVAPDELEELPMSPAVRLRVSDYLTGGEAAALR